MTAPESSSGRPAEPRTEQPTTCPSCGAAVRHAVPWCLQCYASLTAKPQPTSEPTFEPTSEPRARPGPSGAGDGPAATDRDELDLVAQRMLAELSTTSEALPSWWSRLPTTPGAKAVWVAGTIAVASLVLVLVMAIVGLVL